MKLMNDPKNQQRMLQAVDAFQRTKTELGRLAEQALHTYNLPSQKDVKSLGKKVTSLRKEAQEIRRRLEELK